MSTTTLPYPQKLVLQAILNEGKEATTDDVYIAYRKICEMNSLKPLTKIRISNFISELEILGLINAREIYKGRYGHTRIISHNVPRDKIDVILNNLDIS